MTNEFDVVVIGGGPAGENAAAYARDNGLEVALVERELVGGECSYWACMPSKALLRPGEALAASRRRVPGAAPAVTGELDVDATLRSRDAFSSHWDDRHQVDWVESTGTSLIRGHARLAGEQTVEVEAESGDVRILHARRGVAVATGSSAAVPPVEGLRDITTWDNRGVTTAKDAPDRLLVLGGVVGVEMAQAFRRLGADQVTIVEMAPRLLANGEPFVDEQFRAAFEDEGITVHVDAQAVRARRDGTDGPVTLTLADGTELVADELLVATGRRPNTGDLGLDTVGLEPGRSIETDDQLRAIGVDGGWLYAVGDVNGRTLLTHHGKYQAWLVGDHRAGKDVEARAGHQTVVRVIFTDPQVAAAGMRPACASRDSM